MTGNHACFGFGWHTQGINTRFGSDNQSIITFQRSKAKVQVPTRPRLSTSKELTPMYAECVNMLEGLADEEIDQCNVHCFRSAYLGAIIL